MRAKLRTHWVCPCCVRVTCSSWLRHCILPSYDVVNRVTSIHFLNISLLCPCASTSELHTTTRAAKARTPPIFCNLLWMCITSVPNRAPPTYRHDVTSTLGRRLSWVELSYHATIYAIILCLISAVSLKPDITVIGRAGFGMRLSTALAERWSDTALHCDIDSRLVGHCTALLLYHVWLWQIVIGALRGTLQSCWKERCNVAYMVIFNCYRGRVDTVSYLVSDWGSCKVPYMTVVSYTGCTGWSNHGLILYTDLIVVIG